MKQNHFSLVHSACVLTILLLIVLPVFGGQTTLDFEGQYWVPSFSGSGNMAQGEIGAGFDFGSDLGIQKEPYSEIRLIMTSREKKAFRVYATRLSNSGEEILTRVLGFSDQLYYPGMQVVSDLEMQYVRLGWHYHFTREDTEFFVPGLLVDVKYVSMDTTIHSPDLRSVPPEPEQISVLLPTVGASLKLNVHERIETFVEISGMKASSYSTILDGEAGVRFTPVRHVGIIAGYRHLNIEAEEEPSFLDLMISGPYLTLSFQF